MTTAGASRRRMVLVGASVFAISVVSHFRTPLLPAIGAELRFDAATLGLVTTSFAAGRLMADLPAGVLVDRIGVRRVFVVAGLVLGLGGAAFTLAHGRVLVFCAAALLGAASALANTTGMTFFSTATAADRRGRSMAVFSASLLGGQAIGPTLGGAIAELGTWRTAMATAAALGLVLAVLGVVRHGLAGVLTRRSVAATRPGEETGPRAVPEYAAPTVLGPLQQAALYAIPFSTLFMLGSLPQTLVPIIGADRLGLSSAQIGLALGAGGVCRMVASPVGGWLADRVSRKGALVPTLFLQALGVAVLAVAASVPMWLTAIVAISLFSFGGVIAATLLGDLAGGRPMGRRLGGYRFVGDSGLLIGPAVTGVVYDRAGQVPAVMLVCGLVLVVAVAAAALLPETRPRG